MKFCINGIATIQIDAAENQPSQLFSMLLKAYKYDKDLALDAYLLTKTSAFNEWYGEGERDDNGEPTLRFSKGGELSYFNGNEFRGVHSGQVYVSTKLGFNLNAIRNELIASAAVKEYKDILYSTGDPESYSLANKITSKYPGSVKFVKMNFSQKGVPIYRIEFTPVEYHAALQLENSTELTTDEDKDFYEDSQKRKFVRTNTMQRSFSEYSKSVSARVGDKLDEYMNKVVDAVWRKRRDEVDETGRLVIKEGSRTKRYTKEEYKQREAKRRELPRLKGKVIHYLYAALDEKKKDPIRSKYFIDKAKEYLKKAEMDEDIIEDYMDMHSLVKEVLDDQPGDRFHNEFTVSITLPDFKYMDKDGTEVISSGYAGTIDRLVLHADGTYTLTDFKTGAVMDGIGGLMNFAREAGVKMLDNSMNRNAINLAMYALMLRSNNRSIKFRDINMLKVDTNASKPPVKLSSGYSFEFASALRLLKEYFKKHHAQFYTENQDLFSAEEYFAASTPLLSAVASKQKEGLSKTEAREEVIKALLTKFREVVQDLGKFPATGLSKEQQQNRNSLEEEYSVLLEQILEMKTGVNPFKYGGTHYMDMLQSMFSNRYGQANNLIASLNVLFAQAKQTIRSQFIDIKQGHDSLLRKLLDETKIKKKLVGANYKDLFSFMWIDKQDSIEMITYKDKEAWSKLTEAQKAYADFVRRNIRYHLFRTMKPWEGIEFIEKELKERVDLGDEDKALLNKEIEELKLVPQFDRFKQSDYAGFEYHEGWTPRVAKTDEEYGSIGSYVSNIFKSNFLVSDEEAINQMLPENKDRVTGLPLRFMGSSEMTAYTHEERYTYNFEIIFNAFVSHLITKEHMDDVYNIGMGIKTFMANQDKNNNRALNEYNINFVESFMNGLVIGRRKNTFTKTVRVLGNNVDVDHFIRAMRSYFGVTTLALNIVGGVSTGINQSLKTMQAAVVGSLGMGNQDMDLKNARKMMKEIYKWKRSQMAGRVSSTPESANANKMALFLDLFNYLPKSYNYYESGDSRTQILTKQGFIAPAWVNSDLLMKIYSSVDNLNYATYLAGQLYKMTTKVNGKEVSMWDAYEVVNGKLVYKGEARGIDSRTGEALTELSSKEIDKLRAYAERDLGPYRDDERSSLDMSSLGSLYLMFKRWLAPTVKRAFSGSYENHSLGKYVNSGGQIDPETGLPVMTWVPRVDEGWVWSTLKFVGILGTAMKSMNTGTLREEWKNMTVTQRENVAYALVRGMTAIALFLLISAIFGDADEDDKNGLKRSAIRIKDDTLFEFIVFDMDRWTNTLVSAPALEKFITTAGAYLDVIFGGILSDVVGEADTVQSGDYKGWYKGSVSALRGTKYASTIFGFYELGKDWEDLDDDINDMRIQ